MNIHNIPDQKYMGTYRPDVLLSGNHKEIELYRRKEALREDLYEKTRSVSGVTTF